MNNVLIIQSDMMLKQEHLDRYHKLFTEQLKTGVVIIPAHFQAKLINVPKDIKVIMEGKT